MDLTAQIKKNLIFRIRNSSDLNFLNALQTIFDSTEQELYQLSNKQQTAIDNGRKDIIEGKIVKSEDVISDMRQWLKKK
ncbi:MAG: hypothetical protein R2779_11350 [Crocinitomicaceae bacterium]